MRIAITGKAGAGKDTAADYLIKKYGFKKIAFADPIYKIAEDLFNMKEKDRSLLQNIGHKMRRINEDVFVDYAFKRAKNYKDVVISDLRAKNELERAEIEKFLIVRIIADTDVRIERLKKRDKYFNLSTLNNYIESEIDEEKIPTIKNNGTFEDLYKNLDRLIKKGEIDE